MSDQPKVVKKVKAYPFPVQLKLATGSLSGQVVKLAPQGFLAEIALTSLQPGDRIEVTFELPVLHQWVTVQCRVIKLYNQWTSSNVVSAASASEDSKGAAAGVGAGATASSSDSSRASGPSANASALSSTSSSPVVQLIEVHFLALSQEHKNSIMEFLKKVGAAR